MKPGIHPIWYPDAVVTCACGNTFTTGSTRKEIHTDVCSNCHPFFTGEQRIVDTAGQVERFMKRAGAKDKIAATRPVVQDKRGKKDRRREEKPTPAPVTPAELPLAVMEEKPQEIAPELPKFEEPKPAAQPQPVAETKVEMPAPVAPVETLPTLPPMPEPAPVAVPEPVVKPKAAKQVKARAVKPSAKKAPAKKPTAKAKKAAPKASIAKKAAPKASAAKKTAKPKTTAKKKSKK